MRSSRCGPATFAAPGTQGRRQSHAKREGRRWGNMNGAHWEDGAAARRTCSTWPFGCVCGTLSCGSVSPPPRGPTLEPARRRKRQQLQPHAFSWLPCWRLQAGSRAREAAGAAVPVSGCGRWARGSPATQACDAGSGARARTQPPTSGAGAGVAADRGLRDTMLSATCARAPSNHR